MELQRPTRPNLNDLLSIFYDQPSELAQFCPAAPGQLPPPFGQLLDHQQHMTVTVEAFHRGPVNVQVLDVERSDQSYSRKIILTRAHDDVVVQFGIVRLDPATLAPEVFRQIESETTPLGRVLIANHVMRHVKLHQLYEVQSGPELARLFDVIPGSTTYGRTALIYCDGEPAVELLEIVSPVDPPVSG